MLRRDQRIDGITCETREQLAFHIHAHLRIVVDGRSRRIPAAIGTAPELELGRPLVVPETITFPNGL